MFVKYLFVWIVLAVVATANGIVRQITYDKIVSELAAHQISTVTAILAAAREAGYAQMEGIVLRTNSEMLQLANELGFEVSPYPGDAKLLQIRKKL